MAALRRGVPFVSFLQECFQSAGRQQVDTPAPGPVPSDGADKLDFSECGWRPLLHTFLTGENLSHEALIRRASSLVTDSANTYLSQTTLALVDSLTQYSKALHTLIALQKRYLSSIERLTPAEEDSIWQVIIGQRAEVGDRLDECKRFESNWVNAVHLCELAAEAAYSAGVEHASISTRTNLQVSQSQVERVRKLSLDAQRKLSETKAEEVQRMVEFSAMERMTEDIPEAYLRED